MIIKIHYHTVPLGCFGMESQEPVHPESSVNCMTNANANIILPIPDWFVQPVCSINRCDGDIDIFKLLDGEIPFWIVESVKSVFFVMLKSHMSNRLSCSPGFARFRARGSDPGARSCCSAVATQPGS